jgi:hypothetical protein
VDIVSNLTNPLHTPFALFEPRWVPGQIDVDLGTQPSRQEREFWLAVLDQMAPTDGADAIMRDLYIRDLRRKLGLGQPIDVVRAQTRERVRRFRRRQAQP